MADYTHYTELSRNSIYLLSMKEFTNLIIYLFIVGTNCVNFRRNGRNKLGGRNS